MATELEVQDEAQGEFSIAPSNGAKVELSSLREQARLALADDDQASAVRALRAIVNNYPEDLRAPKQLASLLFSQQRFNEAAQVLENALEGLPADSSLRMMLSRIAFKTGDIQSAYDTLAAHPFERLADIELLSFRAALAERLQHYEHANQDYSLLVGREPRNARWWLGLGVSQDKLAQNAAAIKSYQQAKDLNQLPSQVREFLQERIEILARQS
jgi:MSHA biogenesis protein MshN